MPIRQTMPSKCAPRGHLPYTVDVQPAFVALVLAQASCDEGPCPAPAAGAVDCGLASAWLKDIVAVAAQSQVERLPEWIDRPKDHALRSHGVENGILDAVAAGLAVEAAPEMYGPYLVFHPLTLRLESEGLGGTSKFQGAGPSTCLPEAWERALTTFRVPNMMLFFCSSSAAKETGRE